MLIFWFSQSPTDHCLVLTIPPPPPPLSLFLLSDWASSPALKIVGDLLDLASCVGWWPQHCTWHQLLPVTDTVLWPVCRGCRGTIVFTHNYLLRGCGGSPVYLLQHPPHPTHNVANISRPIPPFVFMIRGLKLITRPSDYKDSCQGGGGGGSTPYHLFCQNCWFCIK